MKKFFKKGDGLATIIITIVLIVIVLLIVPVLKAFQANAGANTKQTAATQTAMINGATSGASAAVEGESGWQLSDTTQLYAVTDAGNNG